MEEYICPFCNKLFKSKNAWCSHKGYCKKNPNCKQKSIKFLNAVKSYDHSKAQKSSMFTCEFCNKTWETTKSGFGTHKRSCLQNPNRVSGSFLGRKHTEESKQKMKQSIQENDKHFTWGDLSRRCEHSYPEKWLIKVLEKELFLKENVDYKTEVHFHTFWLDFVFGDKYVIEMDGSQHLHNDYQKDCDARKDALLKQENFKELRLSWAFCKSNPQDAIQTVKDFLEPWVNWQNRQPAKLGTFG